jgi:transketolase
MPAINGFWLKSHTNGMNNAKDLDSICRQARVEILTLASRSKSAHVASCLSCVELLVALYFSELRIDPQSPRSPERDRFILSKGHAAMALYTVLCMRGFFDSSLLAMYGRDGSALAKHPAKDCVPGVEVSTGSLGHGLSVGAGIALKAKLRNEGFRVFVLMSDGECNEGSVWETAMFAAKRELSNLIAIVDYNGYQATGRCEELTALAPLADKWRAFGWRVVEIDGHDISCILNSFEGLRRQDSGPAVILARTIKGKAVSFMENNLLWHYRPPNKEELEKALAELRPI